jgi:hypothetical protein
MSSIVFVIIGIGFLVTGYFGDGQISPRGRRGYFRAQTSRPLPISRRTGEAIGLVVGSGFAFGGALGVAIEVLSRR